MWKEIEAIEKEKKQDEFVNNRAKELIRKHKRYIGEEVAEKAIDKLSKTTKEEKNKNVQLEKDKEETENGDVQEKGKRGRPRRKAWRWL